jgi:hypothetical protein
MSKIAATKTYVDTLATPFEYNAGNSGTAITLNWANGEIQKVTMTGNCVFGTFLNPVVAKVYVLKLVQDGTGGRSYTWPGNVKWSGGSSPAASTLNKVDTISLYYDGTNYYGTFSLNY